MSTWKQRVYEKHHPERRQPAHALAAELNATVRCARYADPEHRKRSLKKLAVMFGAEEQRILLGR